MTANALRLDLPQPAELARRVDAVLGDALYWFPLRHHSPTVASVLERAIRQRRPRLLFLEAPAGLAHLLTPLLEPDTRPPVALYSSFRDDTRMFGGDPEEPPLQLASWFPLLACSPEYVAIRTARAVGAEVVFIDLPHAAVAAARIGHAAAAPAPEAADSDQLLAHTDLYARLARAAGYRRWDEAWDSLFEHGAIGMDVEAYRHPLAAFCAAARASSGAPDGDTLARERHMWRCIRETLAARALPESAAMVVCGGYHLFLDRADPAPPPPLPPGTLHHALVPYSYLRIWERTGYGAGNRAPQFYQRLFDAIRGGNPDEVIGAHVVDILRAARRQGERLATADAIAVQHHATLLAQLRGRSRVILDDLDDALLSCCVKGDPAQEGALLRKTALEIHIGNRVGKVSASAGQLPLVRDYYAQLEALELGGRFEAEQVQWLELDRRTPLDAARSAFLHRLRQLEVPLGEPESRSDALGQLLFRERWRLAWSAGIEAALIERSLDGDTVAGAALTALSRALAQSGHDAAGTCRLLRNALAMDLPQMLARAESACQQALDMDSRFASLVDALTTLRVIERMLAGQPTARTDVAQLIERAWDRACFALADVTAAAQDEHPAIIDALKALAEVALTREDVDAELFARSVQGAAAQTAQPELRGAFLAMLVEIRRLDASTLAGELAGYADAAPQTQPLAGDFLHGVLAVSTTAVMVGAGALVAALDRLLKVADGEVFMAMLPRLRAAIEQLHPRHRDAFAAAVARHLGLGEAQLDRMLDHSAAGQALIVELDRETAAIMADWGLA